MIHFSRPLVCLDLKTTSPDRNEARIISLSMYKVLDFDKPMADPANRQWLHLYVDPGIPIAPPIASATGITNELLLDKKAKPFFQVGEQVRSFIAGCDLLGYNLNFFDVPVLANEFTRAAVDWDVTAVSIVDVGSIFKITQPRTLSAAVEHYLGRPHRSAGMPWGSPMATIEVFLAQLERHPELPADLSALDRFSNYGRRRADVHGYFYYDAADVLRYGFGKYKHQPALDQPQHLAQLWQNNLPADTAEVVASLLKQCTATTSAGMACDSMYGEWFQSKC